MKMMFSDGMKTLELTEDSHGVNSIGKNKKQKSIISAFLRAGIPSQTIF